MCGRTTLCMDSGEKVELSKQILQLQKTHAITEYKRHCEKTDLEGLCDRKLFDILTGLKLAQQRIIAGLDDFAVEGIEAWHSLSGTCKLELNRILKCCFSNQALLTQCEFHKVIKDAYINKLLWESSIKKQRIRVITSITQILLPIVQRLVLVIRNILNITPSVLNQTVLIVLIVSILFEHSMRLPRKLRKLVMKRSNARSNTTLTIHHTISSNGLVITFVQLNKMQQRTRSCRKWKVTSHFVRLIRAKRSYLKNIERNKVRALEKRERLCWLVYLYKKIQRQTLQFRVPLPHHLCAQNLTLLL